MLSSRSVVQQQQAPGLTYRCGHVSMLRYVAAVFCLFGSLLAFGCTSLTQQQAPPLTGVDSGESQTGPVGQVASFVIGFGDTLAIEVYRDNFSDFIVWKGDSLNVEVYRQADLSKTYQVDASGNLVMPLVGSIDAAGKSVASLSQEIHQKLLPFLVNPQVTISLTKKTDLKISELSQTIKIGLDGRVKLPIVGEMTVVGMSIPAMEQAMKEKLTPVFNDPIVTVNVTSVQSKKALVLGEVMNPGVLPFGTPISLLEAVALSGGFTKDANIAQLCIINRGNRASKMLVVDAKDILKNGDGWQDSILQHGDIVYVPAEKIADISWFFSHLNQIIPPIVEFERGTVLWPATKDVLKGGGTVIDSTTLSK